MKIKYLRVCILIKSNKISENARSLDYDKFDITKEVNIKLNRLYRF